MTSCTRATLAASLRGPVSSRWLATISEIDPVSCVRAVGERDEVIADALELGDDVGRENDRYAVVDDGLHHRIQELAPRERVERGDRLVEQQQLRLLGERQRQRDLRLLAAGKLADLLLDGKAETLDSQRGQRWSQLGLSLRP